MASSLPSAQTMGATQQTCSGNEQSSRARVQKRANSQKRAGRYAAHHLVTPPLPIQHLSHIAPDSAA